MQKIRAYVRIVWAILIMIYLYIRLLITNLIAGKTIERGFKYRQKYIRAAMRTLGLRIDYQGKAYEGTCLYISNHRSMVDPMIVLRNVDAYVVSKAEVEKYPVIGPAARDTGTIYVHRNDRSSRYATKEAIKNALENGQSIMLFPEGTTSDSPTTIDFKLGSFKVAHEVGVPVVPVAVDYENKADYWVNKPMLAHFSWVFSRRRIFGKVKIGEPIYAETSLLLMRKTKAWIDETIPTLYNRETSIHVNAKETV